MNTYRNSQKRYYDSGAVYYIVTKTFNNFPFFKEKIFCDLFIEELKLCKELKKFKLYAFCLIYDHLNLLIQPNDEFNISKVMQSIKKETSRDINYIMSENEGDISECRLQETQYSRRYKKNYNIPHLSVYRQNFLQKYNRSQNIIPKFQWQKSFHDHIIRINVENEQDFRNHYNYTIYNYCKHKLPDNWKYTSLNYFDMMDEVVL